MSLEVIWTGANDGRDGDLLCCPKIPQKRTDVPLTFDASPRSTPTQDRILAALALEPMTKAMLIDLLALTPSRVENALHRLRDGGLIHAVGTIPNPRTTGLGRKRLNVYGLVEGL